MKRELSFILATFCAFEFSMLPSKAADADKPTRAQLEAQGEKDIKQLLSKAVEANKKLSGDDAMMLALALHKCVPGYVEGGASRVPVSDYLRDPNLWKTIETIEVRDVEGEFTGRLQLQLSLCSLLLRMDCYGDPQISPEHWIEALNLQFRVLRTFKAEADDLEAKGVNEFEAGSFSGSPNRGADGKPTERVLRNRRANQLVTIRNYRNLIIGELWDYLRGTLPMKFDERKELFLKNGVTESDIKLMLSKMRKDKREQ